MNLSKRSNQKELLDGDRIPFIDIKRNMEELDFINKYLGGHKITIAGIRNLLSAFIDKKEKDWLICEIGCGGGDNLLAIADWCRKEKVTANFIGIDINPYCIDLAAAKLGHLNAGFIAADYKATSFSNRKPDVVFSSLFCHHFTNEELIGMLRWMQENALAGFFINDLHRHNLAFYSIKLLTKFFSGSYLVKNDAPLSVLRGFKKSEWKSLLEAANIRNYTMQWKWAFRHLITVQNNIV